MDTIDKINYYLTKNGMTGADLERKIGVSNSVYSQWNTRTTKPSKKSLIKVAEALCVPLEDLLPDNEKKPAKNNGEAENAEEKEKSPTPDGVELDAETIQLKEIWDSADQEERDALLAMAKMLKARRPK